MHYGALAATSTLVLLGCVAGAVLAESALKPRGVMTALEPLYADALSKTPGSFTCLDGSKTVPASKVNDEYCDCKDGSDEPGTAACTYDRTHSVPANFRFQCANVGYKPQLFFHSRVNDGICDCCDGSDEYLY